MEIGHLPIDIDSRLGQLTAALDSDTAWKITRLAEAAYGAGLDAGYTRGMTDEHRRSSAAEKLRQESHENTCPARRQHAKCACKTRPEGMS